MKPLNVEICCPTRTKQLVCTICVWRKCSKTNHIMKQDTLDSMLIPLISVKFIHDIKMENELEKMPSKYNGKLFMALTLDLYLYISTFNIFLFLNQR